jgi:hypothetical protein
VVDVSKEAVRIMRDFNGVDEEGRKKGGLVIQVSSLGGQVALAGNAFYHARSVTFPSSRFLKLSELMTLQ